MADLRATPMVNPVMGLLADRLKKVQQFGAKPFGYENPPVEMLMNLLGVPAVQQTMERMAYGEPLTTGIGMTTKPRAEAVEAAMAVAPVAGLLGKATKGLPVGASVKNVAKVDELTGLPLNADGTVTVYHHTNKKAAEQITSTKKLKSAGEPDVYVTTEKEPNTGYGDTVVPVRINPEKLILDDEFPSGRMDFRIPSGKSGVPIKLEPKPSYPQQEALDTAQRNAALPIEEGGLGLPKDNTAMDRAKAMGFDAEALHGSPSPYIESFDPMMAGRNTGNAFDNNIFATTNPESATGYALNWKHYRNVIKTSPEYKLITREENALLRDIGNLREEGNVQGVADARAKLDALTEQKNAIYNDFMAGKLGSEGSSVYPLMVRSQDFLPYEAQGANWMRANRPAIDAAEEQGYSGAVIKNVRDNAGANLGTIADVYATSDPSRFRSRFAAFDPMRSKEADILAGVLPLGLLADEEQRKKIYELMPSLLGQ